MTPEKIATSTSDAAPSSSRSQSINSTRLNRFLVLAAIKLIGPFQPCWGCLLFITPIICVKIGSYTDLSEASTMQSIQKNTSIPLPRSILPSEGKIPPYVVMERIAGKPAATSWLQFSEESKTKMLGQLRGMINEMRKISATNGRIANVDGGTRYDCRLPCSLERFGPFENTQEFYIYLRNSVEKAPPGFEAVDDMIRLQKWDWGQPVFTYGDLSSLNFIIRGDNIAGLVDWETVGWYPPYWEYTSACQVNIRNLFGDVYTSEFIEPWPEALEMEKTRHRW